MADLLDKAILIGLGLEKKAKEVLDELQQAGKAEKAGGASAGAGAGEDLTSKQLFENKVVEEGVKNLKEFLGAIKGVKEKIEKELEASSGKVLGRFNVPTNDEVEVIKEMARLAREKVDRLEKKVEELEARLGRGA